MYPKWIEVHELNDIRYPDNHLVSVNVDNITFFSDKTIFIPMPDDNGYYTINVTESYDELKQLITDAGYAIHKADPRLDTTHPLTMAELKSMIGEPVWSAYAMKWLLVESYIDADKPVIWLVKPDSQLLVMSAEDLEKYPVYRMQEKSLIDVLREVRGEK